MEWLNYNHLLYFWTTVRAGTLAAAARELRLAPPTVHAQIRSLEEQLGAALLVRRGRTLVPTDAGRLVFSYADRIFGLGRELMDAVKQRPVSTPLRLAAGIDDVLPKEIAHALLAPAVALERPVRLLCHEGSLEPLLARLALHELDVVLSDAPVTPGFPVRAYNHLLGETAVVWMGERRLASDHRRGFPRSLDGAPVLLPTDDTAIRRDLDQWCDRHGVRPQVIAEFEDYGLLREFGQRGAGVFPVPAALEREFARRYGLRRVGSARGVVARFYAVTIDRQIRHPAAAAITGRGRGRLAPLP